VQALKAAGKNNVKDVFLVGFNGDPPALELIKQGEMAATIRQSSCWIIRWTRFRVGSEIPGLLWKTADTVWIETCAFRATSVMVFAWRG
jgi:hypothetical protein